MLLLIGGDALVQCSESNLLQIKEVAYDIGGEEYSDRMIKRIEEIGYINMAQRYFGLCYPANRTCIGNKAFIQALLVYGFTWIKGNDFP